MSLPRHGGGIITNPTCRGGGILCHHAHSLFYNIRRVINVLEKCRALKYVASQKCPEKM